MLFCFGRGEDLNFGGLIVPSYPIAREKLLRRTLFQIFNPHLMSDESLVHSQDISAFSAFSETNWEHFGSLLSECLSYSEVRAVIGLSLPFYTQSLLLCLNHLLWLCRTIFLLLDICVWNLVWYSLAFVHPDFIQRLLLSSSMYLWGMPSHNSSVSGFQILFCNRFSASQGPSVYRGYLMGWSSTAAF